MFISGSDPLLWLTFLELSLFNLIDEFNLFTGELYFYYGSAKSFDFLRIFLGLFDGILCESYNSAI